MDLFSKPTASENEPLAYRMRPRILEEFAGQHHLTGPGKPLRKMVEAGIVRSMVLWGPPGTGKTTLAEILANACGARLERLSAVMAGVKDIRAVVDRARTALAQQQKTVLFLDEIHRLNTSQQDALLPHVESGLLTIISATTHNPSFQVNSALLSRARVYVLNALTEDVLLEVLKRALRDELRGLGDYRLRTDDAVLGSIARAASGDARRALGLLESAIDLARDEAGDKVLDMDVLRDLVDYHGGRMDKSGDVHYDLLSAVHKSARSSRPQAVLLYMARYINSGGDPLDIIRRMACVASEDVGNTDPKALPLVMAAWDAYLRLGQHEGERAIAHAGVYLAVAPKSNTIDAAWKAAKAFVSEHPDLEPPLYIRNAPTQMMKELGYNKGYRYAHDEPNAYPAGAGHNCWPDGIPEQTFYRPTRFGHEDRFAELMRWRADLDREADG